MRKIADGILILGMHRSGTSAVAGTLDALGVTFGEPLMAPRVGENSRGYFEHLEFFDFHKNLFAASATTWDDPRGLDLATIPARRLEEAEEELARLLALHFAGATTWAVKDPRLCRLLPIWHRALERLGARARHILVLRHPDEVAASLAVRDGFSREKSDLLWAEHLLEAELRTRGTRRAMISFEQVLADPEASFETLSERLQMAWPRTGAEARAAVRHFLDRGLRHHRASQVEARGRLGDTLPRLYAELLEIADIETGGGEPNIDLLDELHGRLHQRRREIEPLYVEHAAQLAQRGERQREDLDQSIKELGRSIDGQNKDLEELRDLVQELEEQLRERTRWLQIQDRILHDQVARIDKLERGEG